MSDITDNRGQPQPDPEGKYILVNAYDELVRNNVWDLIVSNDACQCEKCFLDVCALVLNNKRTSYVHFVTTRAGGLFTKVPQMNYGKQAEMTVIILDAIKRVSESPQHDF